jgi:hypothetical protein
MATNNSIELNDKGIAYYDGVGTFTAPTLTPNGIILGDSGSTNSIVSTTALTNGQILIGSTGSAPVLGTLTAGSGIGILNAAASITISTVGGGLTWTSVVNPTFTMVENNGYIANNSSLVVFTLPAICAQGSIFAITGGASGNGLWRIAQNAGQTIHYLSTTTTSGTSGSISNVTQYQTLYFLCITANTTFSVLNSTGNFTVV